MFRPLYSWSIGFDPLKTRYYVVIETIGPGSVSILIMVIIVAPLFIFSVVLLLLRLLIISVPEVTDGLGERSDEHSHHCTT